MEYQWAAANLKKHGVAFSDAALALEDPYALTLLILMQSTNQGSYALAPIPAVAS
jgi:uncharacterized DUF497 family protein